MHVPALQTWSLDLSLPIWEMHLPLLPNLAAADEYDQAIPDGVARVALVGLLYYLECQRVLAVQGGADVDVRQFAAALRQHIVDRCLCSSRGPIVADQEVQLGYK